MVAFQPPLDMGHAARTVPADHRAARDHRAASIDGKFGDPIIGIAGGNLSKTGSGILACSGTNNHVGTATVSAGTLPVNGNHHHRGGGAVLTVNGAVSDNCSP
ncbi:MAG: autotransporter-associated beta strand repeat-containing protein [Verrucomicrobia bacterium]|nr:autotransporter-associated beta strand repeat-containing protein [Verrucomicrobiota bacterium]